MLRAAVLRHGDGCGRLIVARVRKANVERADGAAVRAAVSGNDEGGVDAAAQECRNRDVSDRLGVHRPEQAIGHVVRRLARQAFAVRSRDGAMKHGLARLLLESDAERRARAQGVHVCEPGRRLGNVSEAQVIVARLPIERGAEARMRCDRLDLAREHPLTADRGVEQRLHAVAIASEQQRAAPPVVQREGEDAAELVHQSLTHVLVQMDEHLGVRRAAEPMTAALQVDAEFAMVVDLAVEDDEDLTVLIREGLIPRRRKVDEGEAAMHQFAVPVREVSLAVGAAMREQARRTLVPHARGRQTGGVEATGYATHGVPPGLRHLASTTW